MITLPKCALRRLPKSIPRITERQLEDACCAYLELDGWVCRKMEQNFSERKRKVVGEKGMADRLCIRYGKSAPEILGCFSLGGCGCAELMWIEFKRERGGDGKKVLFTKAEKAKIHQVGWIAAERARGGLVLLCGVDFPPTIEGFQKFYRESGLCRRMR